MNEGCTITINPISHVKINMNEKFQTILKLTSDYLYSED